MRVFGLRLERGNPFEGLVPQRRRVARNLDLAHALDVWDTAVERRDELAQMSDLKLPVVVLLAR